MYDAFYSQVSTTQHRALELPAMPIDHYIHFVIKPRKRPEFSTFEARIIKPLLRKIFQDNYHQISGRLTGLNNLQNQTRYVLHYFSHKIFRENK